MPRPSFAPNLSEQFKKFLGRRVKTMSNVLISSEVLSSTEKLFPAAFTGWLLRSATGSGKRNGWQGTKGKRTVGA